MLRWRSGGIACAASDICSISAAAAARENDKQISTERRRTHRAQRERTRNNKCIT